MITNIKKKTVILAYSCMLLLGALVNIINATLVPLAAMYSTDVTNITILISCLGVGRIISQSFCGVVADRYGRKVIALTGLMMTFIFYFSMPILQNISTAIIACIIGGMGFGMVNTSILALIFDLFAPSGRNSTAQSYVQLLFSFGGVVTPFAANRLLANSIDWGYLYWGCAAFAFILMLAMIFIRFPERFISSTHTTDFVEKPRLLREGILICVVVFFIYGTSIVSLTWVSALGAEKLGVSDTTSVLVLAVYNIGCVIGTIFFAQMLKRIHGTILLITNSVVAFLAFSVSIFVGNSILFLMAVFSAGFVVAVTFNIGIGIGGELFNENAATISAMVSITSALNTLILPPVSGYIYKLVGIKIAFSCTLLLSGLAIIAAVFLRKKYTYLKGIDKAKKPVIS